MSHKSWEGRVTALAAEASKGLRHLALPVQIGDRAKTQIARAAHAAGLSYWRAYDLWYGRARRLDASELDAIRVAQLKRSQDETDARQEIAALKSRIADLERRIAGRSPAPSSALPSVGCEVENHSGRAAD